MSESDNKFLRLELIVGSDGLEKLRSANVALFGIGGVGSWCAEGLIRSGIERLTMVDSDVVCPTNINRQLHATVRSVGKPKVNELRRRLLEINPDAEIAARQEVYNQDTHETFHLETFDYVLDCVDSLSSKVYLIAKAQEGGATLFSAMGASRKLDPTLIRVGPFWDARGCPLAKHLRKRLRNRGATGDFLCVYSSEKLPNVSSGQEDEDSIETKQINGSAVHVTATFGFHLAGLVIQDIVQKTE
ncbi:MAG: tRNA threonylcarbamoyladenosine dehydratase [Deltaproteobacteria bacterium]|nr:tRNA threonylcarbamoyladenosine dehydratase [Deltaproteobacteria bacterium]